MEQLKLNRVMENIGYIVATLFVITVILYFAFQPQGVASCTGSFLNQEMTVADVKTECPNLTKSDLVNALIESDDLTKDERDQLLTDITENY